MSKEFILPDLSTVVSLTAISAYKKRGLGDKTLADAVATETMRKELNKINNDIRVVIGEGERDNAPMLFIGEKLGNKTGSSIDIAVDPLENTNAAAYNLPNAVILLAQSEKGGLTNAPDIYMDKLCLGKEVKKRFTLDDDLKKIVNEVAKVYKLKTEDVVVAVLNRERNEKKIKQLRKIGVKVIFLEDGDVTPGIATNFLGKNIHIQLGIGAAPEGVITAAAIKCLGGQMSGRFWFKDSLAKNRFIKMNSNKPNRLYREDELVSGQNIKVYIAGVTDGILTKGIEKKEKHYIVEVMEISSKSPKVKLIKSCF